MLSLITLISICSMQQGEPRHIAQIATVNGIDFKNPFTMSNRGASAPECRHLSAEPLVFIIWKLVSCGETSPAHARELVEPIGIEPMT